MIQRIKIRKRKGEWRITYVYKTQEVESAQRFRSIATARQAAMIFAKTYNESYVGAR